jgi:PadR family transcriptional regulator, regulatory protein AphA
MTNLTNTDKAGLTDAEYAVLGLLADGESSGYDLGKLAEPNVDLILAPTKSRIYAVLPRLLERGLVSEREVTQERRPDKRLYRLTKAGRDELKAWLNDTGTPLHRDLLLLKLFFGRHADPAALLEQVRAFREAKERELERLADYGHRNLKHPAGVFRNLTVGFGLDVTQSSITWASEAIRTLGELL